MIVTNVRDSVPVDWNLCFAFVELIQHDGVVFDFPVFHQLVRYSRLVLIIVEIGLFDGYFDGGLLVVKILV